MATSGCFPPLKDLLSTFLVRQAKARRKKAVVSLGGLEGSMETRLLLPEVPQKRFNQQCMEMDNPLSLYQGF